MMLTGMIQQQEDVNRVLMGASFSSIQREPAGNTFGSVGFDLSSPAVREVNIQSGGFSINNRQSVNNMAHIAEVSDGDEETLARA